MGVLPLESVIGFDGKVNGGLVLHPDGRTLIYPLGATVVVKELGDTFAQTFLQGHTDEVSCLTVSPTAASSPPVSSHPRLQRGHNRLGYGDKEGCVPHVPHKVKVQDLAPPCGTYLASLGGQDDNSLVIWDVHSGNAIRNPCRPDQVPELFQRGQLQAGDGRGSRCGLGLRQAQSQAEAPLGTQPQAQRRVHHWTITQAPQPSSPPPRPIWFPPTKPTSSYLVLTLDYPLDPRLLPLPQTSNYQDRRCLGHILRRRPQDRPRRVCTQSGPYKSLVPKGVATNAISPTGDIVVGGGDGSVSVLDRESMKIIAVTKLASGVTSCVVAPGVHKDGGFGLYCGTDSCNIYYLKYSPTQGFLSELVQTCHSQAVNDVAFPKGYSEVFATAGSSDVRVCTSPRRGAPSFLVPQRRVRAFVMLTAAASCPAGPTARSACSPRRPAA